MKQQNKYIGIFDSGIGGLTVAKSVIEMMPKENIIYFGDTAHMPYGTKSFDEIKQLVLADVNFLNTFPLKAIMIACNTADSVGRKTVEENYDLPIYGVVEPACKKAVLTTENKKVGVIATEACINSKAYEEMINNLDPSVKVFPKACPLLASLVEEGHFNKDDEVLMPVLKQYLQPLMDEGIDTLVLGCTHYPLVKDSIISIIGNVNIISSSDAAAERLKEDLQEKQLIKTCRKNADRKYFVSDKPDNFIEKASIFMCEKFEGNVEKVDI